MCLSGTCVHLFPTAAAFEKKKQVGNEYGSEAVNTVERKNARRVVKSGGGNWTQANLIGLAGPADSKPASDSCSCIVTASKQVGAAHKKSGRTRSTRKPGLLALLA